jgi:hypothetical protein
MELAEGADWSAFQYEVGEALLDDPTLAFVGLRVPGGRNSVPAFLRGFNGWGLMTFRSGDTSPEVSVRRTPDGRVVGTFAGGG